MEEYILPIKTKIVRDALTTAVQEAITDKGFVLKKTRGTFIQKTSTGLIV